MRGEGGVGAWAAGSCLPLRLELQLRFFPPPSSPPPRLSFNSPSRARDWFPPLARCPQSRRGWGSDLASLSLLPYPAPHAIPQSPTPPVPDLGPLTNPGVLEPGPRRRAPADRPWKGFLRTERPRAGRGQSKKRVRVGAGGISHPGGQGRIAGAAKAVTPGGERLWGSWCPAPQALAGSWGPPILGLGACESGPCCC